LTGLDPVDATSRGQNFLPHRRVIFVVDDDPAMLKAVARLLRQSGYDSVLFPSAEAFANQGNLRNAACFLLDINLNDGASGIDLRLRLKAAGSSVPVIYMTGNDSPAVRMAAHRSGCLAYLIKPFSARSLTDPLEIALAA
jgi:FixJ family two-component response regulator